MCGLTGLFARRSWSGEKLEAAARRMMVPITHRGPDDSGVWVDPAAGVALGFRRLAIVDLSEQGHQPMVSASGRYTIIFNGEVYNYPEIRSEVEGKGHRFRGRSDTEVILAAFEAWGIPAALGRFIGMFAMAVWDAERRELTLVRDRLGIKPMFVYAEPGLVTFGSELKAMLAGPAFNRAINWTAANAFLRYLYVPAPLTIYQNAIKLLPGHTLTIRDPDQPLPASVPFWSAREAARRGLARQFEGTDDEAIEELDRLLLDAVRLRMQADVPLGALLSGGVDSSIVVALMQSQAQRPVKTFTIGFDEERHNEAAHARRVADYLGTEHTDLTLTGTDALAVVPNLATMFDEPLADPSQIPTFLVSRLARREVTVALTGDGGDELFAGYNRYTFGEALIPRAQRMPRSIQRLSAAGISSLRPATWDKVQQILTPILPSRARVRLAGDKLHKLADLMVKGDTASMYRSLISAWQNPDSIVAAETLQPDAIDEILSGSNPSRLLDRMMLADQLTYLPDDMLAKVDRASMAVSLEARVPLLDHRVVEWSWTLPAHMKVRNGTGKWILRQLLYRRVPRELVEREKVGFTVPIGSWLRGPLREWGEELLAGSRMQQSGALRFGTIRRAWRSFLAGQNRNELALWAVLMLLAWGEEYIA